MNVTLRPSGTLERAPHRQSPLSFISQWSHSATQFYLPRGQETDLLRCDSFPGTTWALEGTRGWTAVPGYADGGYKSEAVKYHWAYETHRNSRYNHNNPSDDRWESDEKDEGCFIAGNLERATDFVANKLMLPALTAQTVFPSYLLALPGFWGRRENRVVFSHKAQGQKRTTVPTSLRKFGRYDLRGWREPQERWREKSFGWCQQRAHQESKTSPWTAKNVTASH